MPAVDKFNLHRASSKVELSYYVAPVPPASRYQEAWVDKNVSQQTTQTAKVASVEHWRGGWDTSTKKLTAVPQYNGIVLDCNKTSDAPQQTLVYGKAALPGEGTALSDIYVAHPALRPAKFVSSPSGGTVIPPGAEDDVSPWNENASPAEPYPNTDEMGVSPDKNTSATAIKEKLHQDTPFIPSRLGHVTKYDGARQNYKGHWEKATEGLGGLRLWNVWNLTHPSEEEDGRVYYKNFGPVWTQNNYAGPTLSQDYTEGVLRVKVNASQGTAVVERLAPVEKDIGRDLRYPWIFPYIDESGQPNHSLMMKVGPTPASSDTLDANACEKPLISDSIESEYDANGIANQGFIMNFAITTESDRGNHQGQGGGSPSVTVSWGNDKDKEEGWICGAMVQLIPNKRPSMTYQDGAGSHEVFLSTSVIPDGRITLRVQYLGSHMLVVLNENVSEAKFLRGQSDRDDGTMNPKGVLVKNNSVKLIVSNCTVAFDFQPAYANPWDPSQVVGGGWIDGELGTDPDFHSVDEEHATFENGMVKIKGLANFSYGINGKEGVDSADNARRTYESFREAMKGKNRFFETQVPHPLQIIGWQSGNDQSFAATTGSGEKEMINDFESPMMVLDWRNRAFGSGDIKGGAGADPESSLPIKLLGYQYFGPDSREGNISTVEPYNHDDQVGGLTTLLRVHSTHTSPNIMGFKIPETGATIWPSESDQAGQPMGQQQPSDNSGPGQTSLRTLSAKASVTGSSSNSNSTSTENKAVAEDISQYVESWTIKWTEMDKILSASASIVLLNPPSWMIKALSNNILKIKIHSTGYQINSTHPNFSPRMKQALFSAEPVFEGYVEEIHEVTQGGGEHRVTLTCQDPMGMLRYELCSTNLRLDGLSYLLCFSSLMRISDFASKFIILPYAGCDESIGTPFYRWLGEKTTAEWIKSLEPFQAAALYGQLCFGYDVAEAKSHEINIGNQLFEALQRLLTNMDSYKAMPVFYYDPKRARFTLAFRQYINSKDRLLVSSVPQDLENALPLVASSGEGGDGSFYEKISKPDNLMSHYTLMGSSRFDGGPIKRTVTNPNWNGMRNRGIREAASLMGHVGFVRKAVDSKTEQMFADEQSTLKAARFRMWFKMRPSWEINGMKVLGLVMPNSDDATISVLIEGKWYYMTFLTGSQIDFNAKEGTLMSTFNVQIWPSFDIELSNMNPQSGGR